MTIGMKWKRMSKEEKQPFFAEQLRLSRLHMENNPGYRYKFECFFSKKIVEKKINSNMIFQTEAEKDFCC